MNRTTWLAFVPGACLFVQAALIPAQQNLYQPRASVLGHSIAKYQGRVCQRTHGGAKPDRAIAQ